MSSVFPFKNQCVRDLAWVISAPPLINAGAGGGNHVFTKEYFEKEYNDFLETLHNLDENPGELINHIKNGNTVLLGKYFESLIEFWLKKSKTKELLTHNLQVFRNRQTIGEFDFVYKDLPSDKVIHIECAGKFYIAHRQLSAWDNFIGPNAIDNLGRKLHKVFTDQLELSRTDEGKESLSLEGIDEEVQSGILLKGYLFYYADYFFNNNFVLPVDAEPSHYKGWWIYAKDIDYFFAGKKHNWMIIERMNWISRVYNPDNGTVLTTQDITAGLKKYFSTDTYPLLVAELEQNQDGIYEEVSRGFVVSDKWPDISI